MCRTDRQRTLDELFRDNFGYTAYGMYKSKSWTLPERCEFKANKDGIIESPIRRHYINTERH